MSAATHSWLTEGIRSPIILKGAEDSVAYNVTHMVMHIDYRLFIRELVLTACAIGEGLARLLVLFRNITTLRAVGLSYTKREESYCEHSKSKSTTNGYDLDHAERRFKNLGDCAVL